MLDLLGTRPAGEYLSTVMTEAPHHIGFTTCLTKLQGKEPEDAIRSAYAYFDAEATGIIQDYLQVLLTAIGDWFTAEEADKLCGEGPIDKKRISVTLSSHASLNMLQRQV